MKSLCRALLAQFAAVRLIAPAAAQERGTRDEARLLAEAAAAAPVRGRGHPPSRFEDSLAGRST